MKVILLEDVKKVGKKNELVEVSQGYANNVLFKLNLGVEATKTSLAKLNKKLEEEAKNYELNVAEANRLKEELEEREFVFKLKAGKNGSVFGSVSTKQINLALKEAGYNINKHAIHGDPIAHIGYDKVEIELHKT
ncbi:MAG: 50S ribosomal protein L9, partial [Mycoplasmatales bacterium]